MNRLRWLRRLVLETGPFDATEVLRRQTRSFFRAVGLVRVYYVVTVFLLARRIDLWQRWLERPEIDPLWPVAWAPVVGVEPAVHAIWVLALGSALLCMLFPQVRALRVLVFLGLLEFVAYSNSFGKIGHSYHAWLAVSFVFTFLPRTVEPLAGTRRAARQAYLTVYGGALAMVGLFYSMSGFLKVAVGFVQMAQGEVNSFSPSAMAHQVAWRQFQTNTDTVFGPLMVEYPWAGWLPYLLTIYFELFALLAVFRPRLHVFWGFALLAFHIASSVTMGIGFPRNVLLLGLLFVCSPFSPDRLALGDVVRNLPGMEWRRLRRSERTAS